VVDPWGGGRGFQIWNLGIAEVAHLLLIHKEGGKEVADLLFVAWGV
jgi:hypothetical protein